jgi:segregation and condensation protein A
MAYHVSLSMFDGPLDLLLHLIARAQVDIRDIFISEITDQFLESMAGLDELDMDRASEFLEMAARLLEIKSRRLLPEPPRGEDEEEGEDPEQELIRQLEEYKLFKAASETLQAKANQAANVYYRLPAENVKGTDFDIENASVQLLMQSFGALMARLAEREAGGPEQEIEREAYTVQEQLFRVQGILGERRGPVGFTELFSPKPNREEVVTVFIALLELLRLNRITVRQDGLFGGITVEARARREGEAEYGEA